MAAPVCKKNLISLQWQDIKEEVILLGNWYNFQKNTLMLILLTKVDDFTSIKKPEEILYIFSIYLHHLEFEESGLNIEDMKKIIKERKIIYDHDVGQSEKKFTAQKSLKKVDNSFLPDYISKNLKKYCDWMD